MVIWFFVVVCLFHGYTVLLRGYTVFQRGYIILRGYTTFAWLYGSLPWLFSSFECLYGFPWLYHFSVVIRPITAHYLLINTAASRRQLSAHSEKRVQNPNPIRCIKA